MIFHAGSLSRPRCSSGSAIGSLAIGAVRSAILTYFDLVAMRRTETTDRGPPRRGAERYSGALPLRSQWGPRTIPGVGPGRKSATRERQTNIDFGGGQAPTD